MSLHIATVSSEMIPLAKTGGLGDVCGALPVAMEALGCECTAFLPAYRSVMESGLPIEPTNITFTIDLNGKRVACRILKTVLPNSTVTVYLIDQPQFFDRDGLYSDRNGEYRDNCERFVFYCRSVLEAIKQLRLKIDIVHCHDWQAGLVPAYIHDRWGGMEWMDGVKTIMTIHNLAYQGRFWHLDMPITGLDWKYFNPEQMEFYNDLNLMKTGIVFADTVTTVSPTYAREITTEEHGCGLEGVLQSRGENLVGIVNGVDYTHWDPSTDRHLPQTYGLADWQAGKDACKRALQAELGMEVDPSKPLIGIVSRIANQKGWDLIVPALQAWLEARDVQWAILGTGDPDIEEELRRLNELHPSRCGVRLAFSEAVAHRIEAACDVFLMPSRYEPCGLNQLYSLKYGSVPVVHATGGLADTVVDATAENLADGTATGFSFHSYSQAEMERTLHRAIDFYLQGGAVWGQIVETGMKSDWSWRQSALTYQDVFEKTMQS